MSNPLTTLTQLRAAPVQDGLRFSPDDLEKMPLLGAGWRLQFRHVWLDVHEGALSQHPISQNEFLVLLATQASQQPSDTSQAVSMLMQELETTKGFSVAPEVLSAASRRFAAGRADEEQTMATIARTWRETGLLVDPHTAVGLHVAAEMRARRVAVKRGAQHRAGQGQGLS